MLFDAYCENKMRLPQRTFQTDTAHVWILIIDNELNVRAFESQFCAG